MTPEQFNDIVVTPGLALLPPEMSSREARVMLIAAAGQESGLGDRVQIGGPARGFYQCEKHGGLEGVVTGPMKAYATSACAALAIAPPDVDTIYDAIRLNDALATVIARLILRADPHSLPALGDESGAWACYLRCWGPGRPRPERWHAAYVAAMKAVIG
jgi:hypothetical protein